MNKTHPGQLHTMEERMHHMWVWTHCENDLGTVLWATVDAVIPFVEPIPVPYIANHGSSPKHDIFRVPLGFQEHLLHADVVYDGATCRLHRVFDHLLSLGTISIGCPPAERPHRSPLQLCCLQVPLPCVHLLKHGLSRHILSCDATNAYHCRTLCNWMLQGHTLSFGEPPKNSVWYISLEKVFFSSAAEFLRGTWSEPELDSFAHACPTFCIGLTL